MKTKKKEDFLILYIRAICLTYYVQYSFIYTDTVRSLFIVIFYILRGNKYFNIKFNIYFYSNKLDYDNRCFCFGPHTVFYIYHHIYINYVIYSYFIYDIIISNAF